MTVLFNPQLSFNHISYDYALDKRTRIQNVLTDESAHSLLKALPQVNYDNAYILNGKNTTASIEDLNALSAQDQQRLMHNIYSEASQGVGFYYGRHMLSPKTSHTALQAVVDFLNSESTLAKIKEITGIHDIQSASAQATRYVPGNFLTRHNDLHEGEKRRVAYVLNLTQEWHPDWGGLLQFYQANGTPRDAWAPQFNSLSLFDVTHVHAVTFVAPYAAKPRLAITGWFKATPL